MGVLHRKLVIWMDLNIQSDEFVHSKVVEAIRLITDLKEQLKYVPSKQFYHEVDLDTPGPYTASDESQSSAESVQSLEALCKSFLEMENLIKKNFKLSHEKLMAFTESNPVQITLREELEMVYREKIVMEEENKNLKLSLISNRENDSKNLLELHMSLEKLKMENQVLSLDVVDKDRAYKNQEAIMIKLRHLHVLSLSYLIQLENLGGRAQQAEDLVHPASEGDEEVPEGPGDGAGPDQVGRGVAAEHVPQ